MPNSQSFCFFFQKEALPCLARVKLKAGWYYVTDRLCVVVSGAWRVNSGAADLIGAGTPLQPNVQRINTAAKIVEHMPVGQRRRRR
jgi:hypothetical protein